jgi:OmpA family
VLRTIRQASRTYLAEYFRPLSQRLEHKSEPSDAEWVSGVWTPLKSGNPKLAPTVKKFVAREGFTVQIIGYTDSDGAADENRAIASAWATAVKDALIALNGKPPYEQVWQLHCRLDIVVVGGADPKYDQATPLGRNLSNRVEFAIVEQVIPGEHGFRFFPGFYRNLFDTMRRTPTFNAAGEQIGTAFDQLVPTPQSSIALSRGRQPQEIDVASVTSLFQFHEALKLLCRAWASRCRTSSISNSTCFATSFPARTGGLRMRRPST